LRFEPLSHFLPSGSLIDITGTAGETLSQFNVVYCDSADSGKWKKADSDSETTADVWGIVVQIGGIADDASGKIRLFGVVENPSWAWTKGKKLYLSGTAGLLTETAPTNEYVVAHALSATEIFFAASGGGGGVDALDDLDDVQMGAPAQNALFRYTGSYWSNMGTGSTTTGYVPYIGNTGLIYWGQTRGIYAFTAGETISDGQVVYLKAADSRTYIAQADGTEEERRVLGLAYTAGTAGNTHYVNCFGYHYAAGWSFSGKGKAYLSNTPGALSETAGTNEVIVGQIISATSIVALPGAGGAGSYNGPSWDSVSIAEGQIPIGNSSTEVGLVTVGEEGESLRMGSATAAWSSEGIPDRSSWSPPEFQYKDADEITIVPGIYHKAGALVRSRYNGNIARYWSVTSSFDVSTGTAYVHGSMSGLLGGLINSSWYSVWMVDNGAGGYEVCILPYIREDTDDYTSEQTRIAPGQHAAPGNAENGFVTATDQFSYFRLYLIAPYTFGSGYDTLTGGVDFEATTNGSPDYFRTSGGNYTSYLSEGNWFLVQPPDSYGDNCYLGDIYITSGGEVRSFYKNGRRTMWADTWTSVALNKAISSSLVNTDLVAAASPLAIFVRGTMVASEATSGRGFIIRLYRSNSGSVQCNSFRHYTETSSANRAMGINYEFSITYPGVVRNHAAYYNTSGTETAMTGSADLNVAEYEV
jgi:hypothetical protein